MLKFQIIVEACQIFIVFSRKAIALYLDGASTTGSGGD